MTKSLISIKDQEYLVNLPSSLACKDPQLPGLDTFLFAHGAGAPMDSDYMEKVANLLAEEGLRVVRFEFPYMRQRREDGKKRPPNRENICLKTWQQAIEDWHDRGNIFIAGKSMGGRMASILASKNNELQLPIKAVFCLGYPFHAPGKTDKWKTDHFVDITLPTLILQGDRDPFGKSEEISQLQVDNPHWPNRDKTGSISITWVPDGDHNFKPRVKSGHTHDENLSSVAKKISTYIRNS
ncbi:alpha/beta fold hydrolase [Curvivirga sp.]|uniref:alpha/beta fold hydrolase n=1 Tax=Curvivirga sp. TaxID=2856848 RepID=UPI003B5BDD90